MKRKFLITALGLTMGSALLFSGCKSNTGDGSQTTQATTQAQSSAEKEVTEPTATEAAVSVKMNFDLANLLDEGDEAVLAALPSPAADEVNSESGERVLKYADPERELRLYDDKSGGFVLEAISAKAGDLFSFSADKISLDSLLEQMEGDKQNGVEYNRRYLTVGEVGKTNVVFQSEGYYFIVSVDDNDNVLKDGAAAIVTEDRASYEGQSTSEGASSEETSSAAN